MTIAADLGKWGYLPDDETDRAFAWPGMTPMMEEMLNTYGWNTKKNFEGGENFAFGLKHEAQTTHDKVYPVSIRALCIIARHTASNTVLAYRCTLQDHHQR